MKFFVSYSRSIQDKVREIIAALRDDGETVWWDQDLRPGQDWWGTILDNIETADVCLFFISEKSAQSIYCLEELRYALARNRPLLPYVMDAPITYAVPPEIMGGRIQYEAYSGRPTHLRQRIKTTCSTLDWMQYRDRFHPRPPEPNTGDKDLVDRLNQAYALASNGVFDEAVKWFRDVGRNDHASYGELCHHWIEKIALYQDVAKHAASPLLKSLAKKKWADFRAMFKEDDPFDPLEVEAWLTGPKVSESPGGGPYTAPRTAEPDWLTRAKSFTGKRNADWTPYITRFSDLKIPDMEFCLVPPGTFTMGSSDHDDEKPPHPQTLAQPYWIARTPVTNAQWRVAMKAGVVKEPEGERALKWYRDVSMAQAPVVGVTWFAARDFCAWLGGRLLTEREWEYAARGPDSLIYPWGNNWEGGQRVVWDKNSGSQPNAVMVHPQGASWVGALHLSGNVWEWVQSLYKPYPYSDSHDRNVGDNSGNPRVLRGGSWYFTNPGYFRAAGRFYFSPEYWDDRLGFRCICPI